jgi:[acyl-carrier-protein] S-malonyltransferase
MGALGVTDFLELGAGKVLSGLIKRVLKDANVLSVGTPADVEAAAAALART